MLSIARNSGSSTSLTASMSTDCSLSSATTNKVPRQESDSGFGSATHSRRQRPCRFYQRGQCQFGDRCRNSHEIDPVKYFNNGKGYCQNMSVDPPDNNKEVRQPIFTPCTHFNNGNGYCQHGFWGERCKYSHVISISIGLPTESASVEHGMKVMEFLYRPKGRKIRHAIEEMTQRYLIPCCKSFEEVSALKAEIVQKFASNAVFTPRRKTNVPADHLEGLYYRAFYEESCKHNQKKQRDPV